MESLTVRIILEEDISTSKKTQVRDRSVATTFIEVDLTSSSSSSSFLDDDSFKKCLQHLVGEAIEPDKLLDPQFTTLFINKKDFGPLGEDEDLEEENRHVNSKQKKKTAKEKEEEVAVVVVVQKEEEEKTFEIRDFIKKEMAVSSSTEEAETKEQEKQEEGEVVVEKGGGKTKTANELINLQVRLENGYNFSWEDKEAYLRSMQMIKD